MNLNFQKLEGTRKQSTGEMEARLYETIGNMAFKMMGLMIAQTAVLVGLFEAVGGLLSSECGVGIRSMSSMFVAAFPVKLPFSLCVSVEELISIIE